MKLIVEVDSEGQVSAYAETERHFKVAELSREKGGSFRAANPFGVLSSECSLSRPEYRRVHFVFDIARPR